MHLPLQYFHSVVLSLKVVEEILVPEDTVTEVVLSLGVIEDTCAYVSLVTGVEDQLAPLLIFTVLIL